jgi:hypothetical protein
MEVFPTIMPPTSRDGRPTHRNTYQLQATIVASDGPTRRQTFGNAVSTILKWLQGRISTRLPADAPTGATFEIDEGTCRLEVSSIAPEGIWAGRLYHPDEPFRGVAATPGRTWIVDVALKEADAGILLGLRITCASSRFSTQPIALTRPGVVAKLSKQFTLIDLRRIEDVPWTLATEEDLLTFYGLVTSPTRGLPVVLLTQPDQRDFEVRVAPYLLDGNTLARRLLGLAYVIQMPSYICHAWTGMVGKTWSAFRGAVRTYLPNVDLSQGSPGEHPLALPRRILLWAQDGLTAERAFEQFLVEKTAQDNAFKRVNWSGLLNLEDVKSLQLERLRQASDEKSDWLGIYKSELAAKDAKIAQLEREREEAVDLAGDFEKQFKAFEDENDKLRYRIDVLQQQLAEKSGQDPDEQISVPSGYDSLVSWAERTCAGRLLLHPRAKNAIKGARFEDVGLTADCLLLLAREYRNMKLGVGLEGEAKSAFEKRLDSLHLKCSGSISKERAGEEGDTYFVEYPQGSGRKHFLEFHLRNQGSTRQPERCLAVYFFWHQETRQVIVGWLPSHLENRIT